MQSLDTSNGTFPQQRQSRRTAGFSLLELIGVMTVMSIMASVLMPSMIKQLHLAAAEREDTDLHRITAALKASILRTKAIPGDATWANHIATELGWSESDVFTNVANGPRIFLIDPNLRLDSADSNLPYTQTEQGASRLISPRLLIVSSLRPAKVLPVSSGIVDANLFNSLWNSSPGEVPSGWDDWQGAAEDLRIERINLAPLFKRVVLNNLEPTAPPFYAIDGGASISLPSGGLDGYFIEGTHLSLRTADDITDCDQLVLRPMSLCYAEGSWQSRLSRPTPGNDAYFATRLLADSAQNPSAGAGGTPRGVIDSMTRFMAAYIHWDEAGFPGEGTPSHEAVRLAQAELETLSGQLISE